MVKQGTKYFFNSRPDPTTKFVMVVKNNQHRRCGKPMVIFPTTYDSINIAIIGEGLDLRSEKNLGKERFGAIQLLQYFAPTDNNGFAQLYAFDPKQTSH